MAEKSLVTTDQQAGEYLQKFGKSLSDYAIRKYDHTAFLKSAMLAIADSKELADCLNSEPGKRSLFNALRYASTTGLSLNPQEGKSALIAYGGKIQYQVMKNGMVDLALESGKVDFITAEYVKTNDKFTLTKSVSGDDYKHEPALKDRGDIMGYYAALRLKNGSTHVKWFTAEEISAHRKKYSEKSFMPEIGYGLKTVLKALLRSVSISTDLDTAIANDDFFEADFRVNHGTSADEAAKKLQDDKKPVDTVEQGDLL